MKIALSVWISSWLGEGTIETVLGVCFAGSIAALFAAFPHAIVGAMMFLVGIELVKFARDLRLDRTLLPLTATVLGSLLLNMAVGFVVGLAVHYAVEWWAGERVGG